VGEENREIAAKGFWFQRSDEEKSRSRYQWGPINPQALNRYSYCLGNPLRYMDPTGHEPVKFYFTREMLQYLIGYLRGDYTSVLCSALGGGVMYGLEKILDFVWPIGVIPSLLFGTYDPTNLEVLADKLEALLADNPDLAGFWMYLEQDYKGWIVWIYFTGPDGSDVNGYWGSYWWGLDTLFAQGGFLGALWNLHNQYPNYDFTTDQQP